MTVEGAMARWIDDAREMADLMDAKWDEYDADVAAGGRRYDRPVLAPYPRERPMGVMLLGVDDGVPMAQIGDGLAAPALFTIELADVVIPVDLTADRPLGAVSIRNGERLLREAVATLVVTLVERPVYVYPGDEGWIEAMEAVNHERAARGKRRVRIRHTWKPGERPWPEPDVVEVIHRRIRSRITPERIEQAAAAYRSGGIEEVERTLNVAVRQAWRYVKLAQDRGLDTERRRHT
jgi:hypothetical protein